MRHADALVGCAKDSPEQEELRALTEVIETYEARRWPTGKDADVSDAIRSTLRPG